MKNLMAKLVLTCFVSSSVLLVQAADGRVSDAELRRGVGIINKHYPKTAPSGRFRAEKAFVHNGTLAFKYTVLIPGSVSELKKVFWLDVITRSKAPNQSKVIKRQGSLYHYYHDRRGHYLFHYKVTPEDLRRF